MDKSSILLEIKSSRVKHILSFIALLSILTFGFWSIILTMMSFDKSIPEFGSFATLMLTINTLIIFGIFIWSISKFPKYKYYFSDHIVEITTSKIFSEKELTPNQGTRQSIGTAGVAALNYSVKIAKQSGNLEYLFAKAKRLSVEMDYGEIKHTFTQPSWFNYLTGTVSIFIVGNKGWLRFDYINRKKAKLFGEFIQNRDIPFEKINKIFLLKPANFQK